ncbi:MAG: ExbD/TolR family protein [Phycisphaerales bacterium]
MSAISQSAGVPFDLGAIPPEPRDDSDAWLDPDQVPAREVGDFAHRRRFKRPEPAPMVLNIVSMIDVIFLLMTYFLLTAQFASREESFEVRVPERLEATSIHTPPANPFELPVTPVVLVVTSRGDGPSDFVVFTDSAALAPGEQAQAGGSDRNFAFETYESLTTAAENARTRVLPEDQRFIVRPAADARWEHALGTLNAIKRAGYNNVRFANPVRAGRVAGE